MITADAFQIRDRATGRFLQWAIVESFVPNRMENGVLVHGRPVRWGYLWKEDRNCAGTWSREHVERFLASPHTWTRDLDGKDLECVPGPACECCGTVERGWIEIDHGNATRGAVTRHVAVDPDRWRCEKHIGRNPCCIEGCRKTFAHERSRGEPMGYDTRIMCGRCWRQAPKWMRDRESRIRRLAKKRGWTDRICRLHNMAWEACRRAVERARHTDLGEAVATNSPPPAGLVAELQRLGL